MSIICRDRESDCSSGVLENELHIVAVGIGSIAYDSRFGVGADFEIIMTASRSFIRRRYCCAHAPQEQEEEDWKAIVTKPAPAYGDRLAMDGRPGRWSNDDA